MEKYFIILDDKKKGPYALSQLRKMWASGSITMETLYATEDMKEWANVSELMDDIESETGDKVEADLALEQPQSTAPVMESEGDNSTETTGKSGLKNDDDTVNPSMEEQSSQASYAQILSWARPKIREWVRHGSPVGGLLILVILIYIRWPEGEPLSVIIFLKSLGWGVLCISIGALIYLLYEFVKARINENSKQKKN